MMMMFGRGRCRLVPITDATRYQRGEIWWFENQDDIALMSAKIIACQQNAANTTRSTRRFGCFIQRCKLRTRRLLTRAVKGTTKTIVQNYVSLRDSLRGPNGTSVDWTRGVLFE